MGKLARERGRFSTVRPYTRLYCNTDYNETRQILTSPALTCEEFYSK